MSSKSNNLDGFVTRPIGRAPPKPLFVSKPITDRDSTFTASLFRASSLQTVSASVTQLRAFIHAGNPASHEMYAYRIMSLKAGRDGLRGPEDFELRTGQEDDGEKYGATRILGLMEREGVLDAVVVCSRWYGGTMLGPIRFTHIETCTREVCQLFIALEKVEDHIFTLESLDEEIATLRAKLPTSESTPEPSTVKPAVKPVAKQDYAASLLQPTPDVAKAQRLVRAREGTLKALKKKSESIEEERKSLKASTPAPAAGPDGD